jgi:hypothetical protein
MRGPSGATARRLGGAGHRAGDDTDAHDADGAHRAEWERRRAAWERRGAAQARTKAAEASTRPGRTAAARPAVPQAPGPAACRARADWASSASSAIRRRNSSRKARRMTAGFAPVA